MAGLTLASPIVEAAPLGGSPRALCLAGARDLAALSPPPAGGGRPGDPCHHAGRRWRSGRWRGGCRSTTSISPRSSAGPSWSHPFGTDDLGQDLLARMLYGGRISLAVGLAAMVVAVVVGTIIGGARRHLARRRRHGADVADRSVPVAAGAAAAAAAHVPVPRYAEDAGRATARRLRPDRRGDRRAALDAGGAARARAIPVVAREGVRRGGAGSGRDQMAPGGAPHPAQFAGAGDRRRDRRCRRRDHRRGDPVVSRARLPAGHPELGAHPLRRQGQSRRRAALGAVCRRRDLSCRAVDQLSSATGCATPSTRAK